MAKVFVVGARGRMGKLVCAQVEATDGLELAGEYDVDNIAELDEVAPPVDLVIDFSQPAALPHVVAYVARTGAALVSGTTGLSEDDLAKLRSLGDSSRVVWASNYSLGVAVLRKVAAEAALALAGWNIEIVETHHNQKADAPSGTAKALVACVDPEAERPLVYGREGFVGARTQREIGVHAVRGGTVAGTHEVHFFGPDEELVLTHRATSRAIFANGAVTVARRLAACEPGRHELDDLL